MSRTERNGVIYEAIMVYFTVEEWDLILDEIIAETKRERKQVANGAFCREAILKQLGIELEKNG